jgi:hypothetical protein
MSHLIKPGELFPILFRLKTFSINERWQPRTAFVWEIKLRESDAEIAGSNGRFITNSLRLWMDFSFSFYSVTQHRLPAMNYHHYC